MPRARNELDLELIEMLYGLQCTDAEVAACVFVSVKTIERRKKEPAKLSYVPKDAKKRAPEPASFAEIMERGRLQGKVNLRRKQIELFLSGGDRTMAIWLGKQYLNQVDSPQKIEQTGAGGGPIIIRMSEADLKL